MQTVSGHFVISGKALNRNLGKLSELLEDTLRNVRFDEGDRIKDLVGQIRIRKEQAVTGSGHALAMSAAAASWSAGAHLNHLTSGLRGIQFIKSLHDSLETEEGVKALQKKLQTLHEKMLASHKRVLLVSDTEQQPQGSWDPLMAGDPSDRISIKSAGQKDTAWLASTQVNFCGRAYPTVSPDHDDSPALNVLAGFLRNGYLHRAIREKGGAYGGGASHDPTNGAFRFYSYRDPRLTETLADFDQAIEWMVSETHNEQALEEAVLGVISSMDKPGSPAGEAKQDFHNRLYGRTPEQRQAYREKILKVSLEDLVRVTKTYLQGKTSSTAVVTSSAQEDVVKAAGLKTISL